MNTPIKPGTLLCWNNQHMVVFLGYGKRSRRHDSTIYETTEIYDIEYAEFDWYYDKRYIEHYKDKSNAWTVLYVPE